MYVFTMQLIAITFYRLKELFVKRPMCVNDIFLCNKLNIINNGLRTHIIPFYRITMRCKLNFLIFSVLRKICEQFDSGFFFFFKPKDPQRVKVSEHVSCNYLVKQARKRLIIRKQQNLGCLIHSLQCSFGFIWIHTDTKHLISSFLSFCA